MEHPILFVFFVFFVIVCIVAVFLLFVVFGYKTSKKFQSLFSQDKEKLATAKSLCRYIGIAIILFMATIGGPSFILASVGLGILFAAPPTSDSDTKPETPPPAGN